jgi:hypothetical protein
MQTLTCGTRGVNGPTGQSHREAGEGFDQWWLVASEVSGEPTAPLCSSSQAASIHLGGWRAKPPEMAHQWPWWHGRGARRCAGKLLPVGVGLGSARASMLHGELDALKSGRRRALERPSHSERKHGSAPVRFLWQRGQQYGLTTTPTAQRRERQARGGHGSAVGVSVWAMARRRGRGAVAELSAAFALAGGGKMDEAEALVGWHGGHAVLLGWRVGLLVAYDLHLARNA